MKAQIKKLPSDKELVQPPREILVDHKNHAMKTTRNR